MLETSFESARQGVGLDGPLTQSGALPSTAPAEAEAKPGHHLVRAVGTHFVKGSSGGGGGERLRWVRKASPVKRVQVQEDNWGVT